MSGVDSTPRPSAAARAGRVALRLLAVVLVLYLALIAAAAVFQRQLMYHPDPALVAPNVPGLAIQDVRLTTADGEHLVAWYLPPTPDKPLILYFDGNGGVLSRQTDRWRAIAHAGVGFLAVGYRGYSGSTGHPTEEGLHADARAAYAWVAARFPARDIVIQGHSLGSGVAVRLAAERPARALILESPFTSTVDVAERWAPLAPVRLLMQDRYQSSDWIGRVRCPVLVVHGDRDGVIDFTFGRRLFDLAEPPKTFVRMPGGGHDDLVGRGLYDHVWAFLGVAREAGTADAPAR